jgi:DNA polymerase
MVQKDQVNIIDLSQQYFRHQAILFGDELFISQPDLLSTTQIYSMSNTLNDLQTHVYNCNKCSISATRKNVIFGVGNPEANLMLIGETPYEEEDLQGKPFIGKTGHLLDKMLAAIDFNRNEVFMSNIIKCRPPANRDPNAQEISLCMPYLVKQIEYIQPKIILAFGLITGQTLIKTSDSLSQMRGKVHNLKNISVIVTYHPAALLRNPNWKQHSWEDLQQLRKLYDEKVGDKPRWNPPRPK